MPDADKAGVRHIYLKFPEEHYAFSLLFMPDVGFADVGPLEEGCAS